MDVGCSTLGLRYSLLPQPSPTLTVGFSLNTLSRPFFRPPAFFLYLSQPLFPTFRPCFYPATTTIQYLPAQTYTFANISIPQPRFLAQKRRFPIPIPPIIDETNPLFRPKMRVLNPHPAPNRRTYPIFTLKMRLHLTTRASTRPFLTQNPRPHRCPF